MTGPVAIISALPEEMTTLSAALEHPTELGMPGRRVWSGNLDGRPVVLARGRIGKVNTAVIAALIVERHHPEVLVFSGVAGGLDPALQVGDVVIATRVIQHDAGVLEAGGLSRYQAGHHPVFDPTDALGYTPSPRLLDRVVAGLDGIELTPVLGRVPAVVTGTVLTGDQYVQDDTVRETLHRELGAAAVEMEGGAMAQTAEILGVDHLIIRSLSDLAGSNAIEDFSRYLSEVSANSARVVRHLLPVL